MMLKSLEMICTGIVGCGDYRAGGIIHKVIDLLGGTLQYFIKMLWTTRVGLDAIALI